VRTIEEVLAELRQLAARAQSGEDVQRQRGEAERELAQFGYAPSPHTPAALPAVQPAALGLSQFAPAWPQPDYQQLNARAGSRYIGPDGTADAAAHLAAGGSYDTQGNALPPGWRVAAPPDYAQRGAPTQGNTLPGAMTKALAESTPSAGGVLVPAEVSQDIVDLVRAQVAVMQMGPTVVPVAKELDLPYISTGSAAFYVPENARIPVSEPTFTAIPKLVPIELSALVPVSNRLLRDAQTNPAFEQVIRNDMAAAVSGRQDLAFLQGLGGGNEPLGVRNQAGLTPNIAVPTDGYTPILGDFQRVIGAVRGKGATFMRPGWIFHPDVLTYLETLTDSTGRPLLEGELLSVNPQGNGGTFLRYPFVTSSRIPTNLTHGTSTDCTYVVFGSDWQEAWVGVNLDLILEASPTGTYSPDGGTTTISAWQTKQTVFRATSAHDFALRRPEFFTVMEGVRIA
jgi:HK97 family phage major capsid protein